MNPDLEKLTVAANAVHEADFRLSAAINTLDSARAEETEARKAAYAAAQSFMRIAREEFGLADPEVDE